MISGRSPTIRWLSRYSTARERGLPPRRCPSRPMREVRMRKRTKMSGGGEKGDNTDMGGLIDKVGEEVPFTERGRKK